MKDHISRRQFLRKTGYAGLAIGASMVLPGRFGARDAFAFSQTPTTIPLFGTTLRGIGTIGVAAADPTPAPVTGVTHYTINIDQFQDDGVCPTLGPTTLRGFNPTRLLAGQNNRHLGGILVGQRGVPIQITFRNNLPGGLHIIPNDLTIPGASLGNNRTAVHFHGGLVPWISDGGPFDWWDPAGNRGASFANNWSSIRPRPQTKRSTTTRSTRAPVSAGITTTPSASPASTPTRASPRDF